MFICASHFRAFNNKYKLQFIEETEMSLNYSLIFFVKSFVHSALSTFFVKRFVNLLFASVNLRNFAANSILNN